MSALLVAVAVAAVVVSLVTSVQGAATLAVVCVFLPAVAVLASWVKGSRSDLRRTNQHP